jgi:hypothetical protein
MDILQPCCKYYYETQEAITIHDNIIYPEQQTNHRPAIDITNFTASWPSRQQLEMHVNGNGMVLHYEYNDMQNALSSSIV